MCEFEFKCQKCSRIGDQRYSFGSTTVCGNCQQTVTIAAAPGVVREAIQKAEKLCGQRKYASAYDLLCAVAKRMVHWGETKSLRGAFQRPGGSWDAMGAGTMINRLPREVWRASSALKEAVNNIPRTGACDTFKDEEN